MMSSQPLLRLGLYPYYRSASVPIGMRKGRSDGYNY